MTQPVGINVEMSCSCPNAPISSVLQWGLSPGQAPQAPWQFVSRWRLVPDIVSTYYDLS
jgi:hypothetical protein